MTRDPRQLITELRRAVGALAPVCVMLIALPFGPAFGETLWGDEGGCTRGEGAAPESDSVVLLRPDRIEFYESTCQITAVDTVTETSWRLGTACAGEGETWREVFDVTLIERAGETRLRMADEQGIAWTLAPC